MGKYLITSCSGAGKSAICQELQKRDLMAFDGDTVPGLARWIDSETGQPFKMDYKSNTNIDRTRYHWEWDEAVLMRLLDEHARDRFFLCGSADNQLQFHQLFDLVLTLTVDPEVQRQRILRRTSHNYGKHPEMQEKILAEQQDFTTEAIKLGAIAIDANPDIVTVTNSILTRIDNES